MTPQIALDLSHDGIAALSRAGDGTWWREGVVELDTDDMGERLKALRDRCAARVGEGFTSILLIPEDQLLFTSLERDDRDPKVTIRTLLRGRTPYEVEDLIFDYVVRNDRLQVAVVARDTLEEAESFAAGFGFRPVACVGQVRAATYPGLPQFGPTALAAELLRGERLELDLDDGFDVVPAPGPPRGRSDDRAEPGDPDTVAPMDPEDDRDGGDFGDGDPNRAPAAPLPGDASFGETLAALDPPVPPRAVPSSEASAEVQPTFTSRRRGASGRDADASGRVTPPLSVDPGRAVDRMPRPAPEPPRVTTAPAARGPAPAAPRRDGAVAAMMTPAREDPEEVDAPAEPRPRKGGTKLGLYLTLALLALMGLIALWSLMSGDGEAADPTPASVESELPAVLTPVPDAPEETTRTASDGAALLPQAVVAEVPPATTPENAVVTAPVPIDIEDTAAGPTATEEPAPGPPARSPVPLQAPSVGDADREVAVATDPALGATTGTSPLPPATAPDAPPLRGDAVAPNEAEAAPPAVAEAPIEPEATDVAEVPAEPDAEAEAPSLVAASPEGTLAPGGYTVVSGRPDVLPTPRARTVAPEPEAAAEAPASDPADETETAAEESAEPDPDAAPAEPVVAEGATSDVTGIRPQPRPASVTDAAADVADAQDETAARVAAAAASAASTVASQDRAAAVEAAATAAVASLVSQAAAQAETEPADVLSSLALEASSRPQTRPEQIAQAAAQVASRPGQQAGAIIAQPQPAAPAPTPATQTIRSPGNSVARAATQQNALRLRDINVIGIYGQPNARRALVRLANGRYVKVQVGDRLNRGRVTAIGDTQVVYQQGGRNVALSLPSS